MQHFNKLVVISLCLMTVWAMNFGNAPLNLRSRQIFKRQAEDESTTKIRKSEANGVFSPHSRLTRQAQSSGLVTTFALPGGYDAEVIIGGVKTTFSCTGRNYGYYADPDNKCVIFHVCVPRVNVRSGIATGKTFQYSFICGNQTLFDQKALTCNHKDKVFPCNNAPSIYDEVNRNFGVTNQPFRQ